MSYKYSAKQIDVISKVLNNDLGFINILEGSVRSGKTFICRKCRFRRESNKKRNTRRTRESRCL